MFVDTSAGFIRDLKKANKQGLLEVGETYRHLMKQEMLNTKIDYSKTYHNLKGKAIHHPSEEQYPPAVLSGEFLESLEVNLRGDRVIVLTDVPYALELEFGRRWLAGFPMEPRPVWYPTLENNANKNVFHKVFFNIAKGEMGN